MIESLASEPAQLSKHVNKSASSSRDIQDAVRLVLPGELGKHAISEDSRAVTNYVTHSN